MSLSWLLISHSAARWCKKGWRTFSLIKKYGYWSRPIPSLSSVCKNIKSSTGDRQCQESHDLVTTRKKLFPLLLYQLQWAQTKDWWEIPCFLLSALNTHVQPRALYNFKKVKWFAPQFKLRAYLSRAQRGLVDCVSLVLLRFTIATHSEPCGTEWLHHSAALTWLWCYSIFLSEFICMEEVSATTIESMG